MTSRRFAFTSFTDTKPFFHDSCRYLCYQRETCPTTGRQHWQGYVEFDGNGGLRFSTAQRRLKIVARLAKCNGSGEQNRAYCSKTDSAVANTFEEFGLLGHQGDRSDIKAVADMVMDKKSIGEIATEHPTTFMRMHRGISALQRALMPKRDPKGKMPTCIWAHGPAGSGKSRYVYDNFDIDEIYDKADASKWFDGYTGQKVVVINEFCFSKEFTQEMLLRLCDRYPWQVQDKGGYLPMSADTIILTSNTTPREVLGEKHWDRWARRFTFVDYGEGERPPATLNGDLDWLFG